VRISWINSAQALQERMLVPAQVADTDPEAEMPPYMESFLAHLRLLVGVPFDYLVPDARLLPDESIRFFYVDRSWTDRLVDGAMAVGKIGSRDQAYHQARSGPVSQQIDLTERIVRDLQRNRDSFAKLKQGNDGKTVPADVVTGFLLRSAAVKGWPHMDVRAYSQDIPDGSTPFDPSVDPAESAQLPTLRLELLSPSVMIALFQGIPQLVTIEQPHHGIVFGVHAAPDGTLEISLRDTLGNQIMDPSNNAIPLPVPFRAGNMRVIDVKALYNALANAQGSHSSMPVINGSAAFAIEALDPPFRQRFEGTVDHGGGAGGPVGFVSFVNIAARVSDPATLTAVKQLVGL
jgi:hypothetical protein